MKMINKTKDQAKKDIKNYKEDQFQLYIDEAGWQSWMEEHTEAKDGEEFTESEDNNIKAIQAMWADVHGEENVPM